MALQRQIVEAKATIGAIIAPCRLPMRYKITLPKPFLDQSILQNIPKSLKYAAKRRKITATVSAAQSSPSVDDSDIAKDPTSSIHSFKWEGPSANGKLIIAPLEAHEVGAASVVLTRAFATSPQGVPIEDGRQYCEKMLTMSPKGIFLVGRLHPTKTTAATTAPSAVSWLPEGKTSRLIATASISFHPDSRETFQTLQPPDNDAYLCNIAVDPKFRRQGIARQMLASCETLAAQRGYKRFYLHVRLGDVSARSLYETSGYVVVDEESFLVKLTGRTPDRKSVV